MYQNENHKIDFEKGLIYSKRYNKILNNQNQYGIIIVHTKGDKQLYAHRYIYEEYHKVKLEKGQYVIHKNGIKNDNRIENLELVNKVNRKKTKFDMENNKYICSINLSGGVKYHIKYCNDYAECKSLYRKVNEWICKNTNYTENDLKKYIKSIR